MVKKLYITIFFTLFVMVAHAQSELTDIVDAVKNNKISEMKKYFDNTVPITINNAQSVYSRSQAEIVLKEFFIENNPKDLVVKNSGSPDNTSKYLIGDFNSSKGEYNLYVLLKLKDRNKFLVQEIRINKED